MILCPSGSQLNRLDDVCEFSSREQNVLDVAASKVEYFDWLKPMNATKSKAWVAGKGSFLLLEQELVVNDRWRVGADILRVVVWHA